MIELYENQLKIFDRQSSKGNQLKWQDGNITLDYPLDGDVMEMMDEVKSKTICTDFDEQLDAIEGAYGCNIKFSFDKKDVDRLLDNQLFYSKDIVERVRTIMYQRIRKFQYLF